MENHKCYYSGLFDIKIDLYVGDKMLDEEEYVLLIVKPDGVEKNYTDDVVQFFKVKGLTEVFRKRKKLMRQFIGTSFSAKCMKEELQEYLSSGPSDAVLLKGENAYDIVRLGKVEYRKKNNVDGEIKNMIHSPEAGNEYVKQFSYFFAHLNELKYCMYADVIAKPFYCDDRYAFVDALIDYDAKTNSKIVYVFQKDEFEWYQCQFMEYVRFAQKNHWLFGIEYLCEIDGKEISLIGYYKTAEIKKTIVWDVDRESQIAEIVRKIRENGGIVYLGFSRELLYISDDMIQEFKKMGISGIVLYHPSYTIDETAVIRERFFPNGFLIGGGSGGITEPGSYSISYSLFQMLHDLVYA